MTDEEYEAHVEATARLWDMVFEAILPTDEEQTNEPMGNE